jgi:hypothetical protein
MAEKLERRLDNVESEKIREFADKTELPAMRNILNYVAKRKEQSEGWVNQYCDQYYSDCLVLYH